MSNDPTHGFSVNDRVEHIRDEGSRGTILSIDENMPDVTTCNVLWDDRGKDIVWTNKLRLIDK
jgi:hypothetical protein